jgi:hypothetical protein
MRGAGGFRAWSIVFSVPATPEPHFSSNLRGAAEFRERDVGGTWITRQFRAGDLPDLCRTSVREVPGELAPGGRALTTLVAHLVEKYTDVSAKKLQRRC